MKLWQKRKKRKHPSRESNPGPQQTRFHKIEFLHIPVHKCVWFIMENAMHLCPLDVSCYCKPRIFHRQFNPYILYAALSAPNQNANEIFTLNMLLHVVRPSCDAQDCDLLDLTRGLVQFDRLGHAYGMQSPVLYRTVWG